MTGASERDGCKGDWGGDSWTVPGYVDLKNLGKGGGGRVVVARHVSTGRNVAIKYLNEELCSKSEFRTALRTEARLLSDLTSPHVTRLYEYVEAEQGAAIVMELVYGAALRALLKKKGSTHPEAALVVLKGSLLGLAAAHGVGVVHRDYKPENVLVNWDGRTKLVDFGIAARTGDRHNLCGTCAYMPPEQWKMEAATPAGDVYAATTTLYECLTGVRPFEGPEPYDFLRQHAEEPVPMDRVPGEVRGLIRHGMAKDPALRPANALDFLRELEWVAGNAYGPDWEERGQSRLAAVAAALVPPAISRLDARLVGSSAELARTVLTARRRGRPHRRGDVLTGAAAVAVAGLLSLAPSGWTGGPEAHAGAHTQAVTTLDVRKGTGSAQETRSTGPVSDSGGTGPSGAQDSGTESRAQTGETGSDTVRNSGDGDTGTNPDAGTGTEGGTSTGDTETHGHEDTGTRADTDRTHENTGSETDTDRSGTDSPDDGNTNGGNGGTGNPGTGNPGPDNPGTGNPGPDNPGTGNPGTGNPGTGNPGTGNPGTEGPGTDNPGTEGPGPVNPGTGQADDDDDGGGGAIAGTGDSDPGAAGGAGSATNVGPGAHTSATAGSQESSKLISSSQSLSTTSQSSTDTGDSAGGAGTGSASTPAVTPRQGAPAAVEGEPG
ncbi:serine/threonine-protein kinase [Streptomyces sp. NPDC057002]|uniref:serine/threonine-protein kinase n=1 Tax=Streptomyces sp. NPDC057002 TaxID=3345992 RepID=UPI003634A457